MQRKHKDSFKLVKVDATDDDTVARAYRIDAFPGIVLFRKGRRIKTFNLDTFDNQDIRDFVIGGLGLE